ncbi:MAG: multicopper oxidase domain-containing protein, partial [Nocardioidaceae bacterium]
LYWYHPHVREYYAQELGLYGNVVVRPTDASFWPPSDRDIVLTLDDILIEDGSIAPFDPHGPNFTAMGRFGNVMLIGGETDQHLKLQRGEVGRFYLTNTANTRVFKVALPGCRMKLVGSDAGRYEHEQWVEDVVIAPSERGIVDVLFDQAGEFTLQHITPGGSYRLARISVAERAAGGDRAGGFEQLRVDQDMVAERARSDAYVDAPPDKTLALVAEMDFRQPEGESVLYVCPMHPEVVRDQPGSCPICGMKLMPQSADDGDNSGPGTGHDMAAAHHHDHADAMADGIEWEDMMAEVNRTTTTSNMRWKAVDRDSGKENTEIDWVFRAGDQVKIRLVNEMESDHPMHHPFHIHGQRFLVLTRDGVREANLVWKDTVLIRTGETIDLLMDVSNPGIWMAHCHIPEHMAAGMMFNFDVQRAP